MSLIIIAKKISIFCTDSEVECKRGETFGWLLVARYFLLVARYFLLVARYFLLVAHYFLPVARYFSIVAGYFLIAARQEILRDFSCVKINKKVPHMNL